MLNKVATWILTDALSMLAADVRPDDGIFPPG